MAYIGRRPLIGNYIVLDAITASATTTFNLTQSGSAYSPQLAQNCIVSVNGVIQAPNTSYTISGSTIVFSTALSTTDTINFITVLGDVQNVGTPTAGTVTAASFATGFNGVVTWQNVQTTNFTAVAGRGYPVNTTSAGITMTLPASATTGATIQVVDYAGTFGTNNLTINPNGLKINGLTYNAVIATKREAITLTYIDSTQGWLLTSDAQIILPQPYSISYLMVAGGASGGYNYGAGGGAGGLLTSTTNLIVGLTYTITVGAGGASTTAPGAGNSGSNSSITGLTVAIGGGGGGGGGGSGGNSGGSGGGGGSQNTPAFTAGSGTTGQGNSGGPATTVGGSAGGGGGAGGVGANGSTGNGGNGGIGLTNSLITVAQSTTYSVGQVSGGSVYFAGGGGGEPNSLGGLGGGGQGNPAIAGTVNTGGGGGGDGAAGGSGVVILSMPTGNYSGTYTGSSTYVTTNGTSTVIIFKSSGTYTG